jgi:hypothetical protein
MINRGIAAMYDLIGAGEIKAVKSGGRTLIDVDSLRAYAKRLPEAKVAPPRARPAARQRQSASP